MNFIKILFINLSNDYDNFMDHISDTLNSILNQLNFIFIFDKMI